MSKTTPFPWLETPAEEAPSPATKLPDFFEKILREERTRLFIMRWGPAVGLFILVMGVFLYRSFSSGAQDLSSLKALATPPTSLNTPNMNLMVSLFEIPKGARVSLDLLKPIDFRASSLTPKQRFEAIESSDVERLEHTLVAKKDIPPNKPLFWSDVRLKDEVPASAASSTLQIQFGKNPVSRKE